MTRPDLRPPSGTPGDHGAELELAEWERDERTPQASRDNLAELVRESAKPSAPAASRAVESVTAQLTPPQRPKTAPPARAAPSSAPRARTSASDVQVPRIPGMRTSATRPTTPPPAAVAPPRPSSPPGAPSLAAGAPARPSSASGGGAAAPSAAPGSASTSAAATTASAAQGWPVPASSAGLPRSALALGTPPGSPVSPRRSERVIPRAATAGGAGEPPPATATSESGAQPPESTLATGSAERAAGDTAVPSALPDVSTQPLRGPALRPPSEPPRSRLPLPPPMEELLHRDWRADPEDTESAEFAPGPDRFSAPGGYVDRARGFDTRAPGGRAPDPEANPLSIVLTRRRLWWLASTVSGLAVGVVIAAAWVGPRDEAVVVENEPAAVTPGAAPAAPVPATADSTGAVAAPAARAEHTPAEPVVRSPAEPVAVAVASPSLRAADPRPGRAPPPRVSHKLVVDYSVRPNEPAPPGLAEQAEEDPAVALARAAYVLGNQKLFAGDAKGAISAYREALDRYPGYVGGYRGLGLAYAQVGDKASALSALQSYVTAAPHARDVALIKKRISRLQGK